jgi:energy-coupling factor transporter ATP-binding protein EcfA2
MRPESPWTLILVTDDVDIMAQLNRVIVLDGGKVKHDAPYVQIKNELNA